MQQATGILISIEGIEGAGKTVQAQKLADVIRSMGRIITVLREPGGTKISEQIREVVLNPHNTEMATTTEVLLYQAARAQIYEEIVLKALGRGEIVIMDRTRDSSVAYQGMVRGFGVEKIEQLNDISTQTTYPALTILLDLPVQQGLLRRHDAGDLNRLDNEAVSFHEQVRAAYLKLAKQNDRQRWVVVDAQGDIETVHQKILQTLKEKGIIE